MSDCRGGGVRGQRGVWAEGCVGGGVCVGRRVCGRRGVWAAGQACGVLCAVQAAQPACCCDALAGTALELFAGAASWSGVLCQCLMHAQALVIIPKSCVHLLSFFPSGRPLQQPPGSGWCRAAPRPQGGPRPREGPRLSLGGRSWRSWRTAALSLTQVGGWWLVGWWLAVGERM